jgi:hypothetical protein
VAVTLQDAAIGVGMLMRIGAIFNHDSDGEEDGLPQSSGGEGEVDGLPVKLQLAGPLDLASPAQGSGSFPGLLQHADSCPVFSTQGEARTGRDSTGR